MEKERLKGLRRKKGLKRERVKKLAEELLEKRGKEQSNAIPVMSTKRTSGRFASGLITTSRPMETSIDELIKDIQPMPATSIPGHYENPTTLVILLTPGLARYALDSKLSEALYPRFNIRKKPSVTIETISAIVDRLPTNLSEPTGSEGMAYMLLRNPPTAKSGDRTVLQQSAQRPGSLTFRMPRYAPGEASPVMDHELQLPLSQTVFTTGLVSTLICRRFCDGPKGIKLLDEESLESQTLHLPTLPERFSLQSVMMPLVPLTPFRKISYVMGNIVRKLSSQPAYPKETMHGSMIESEAGEMTDNNMPASQELEASVSKYFEALDLQPETVSVWALVMPRSTSSPVAMRLLRKLAVRQLLMANGEAITNAWNSRTMDAYLSGRGINNAIWTMIPHGARLIKVLSGGGGWGKKAGLLSLDPDVQYFTRELRQDEGWTFDFDGADDGSEAATEAQKNQALGQIVKEGESIMFLLAPKSENLPEKTTGSDRLLKSEIEAQPKYFDFKFGVIPSSIDMVPQTVVSDTDVNIINHYPGSFGMLSEGGMAVTVKTAQGTTGQSKLDVPFGHIRVQQHNHHCWPQIHSAAQYVELAATAAEDAKHATQSTKSVQTASRPRHTKRVSLFDGVAEYDGSRTSQTPSVDNEEDLTEKYFDPLTKPQ